VNEARSGECFFEIILRRYETRSTIMTNNRPLEHYGNVLGEVPSATAILDRFLYRADLIELKGKSYRLNNRSELNNTAESGSEDARRRVKPDAKEETTHGSKLASHHRRGGSDRHERSDDDQRRRHRPADHQRPSAVRCDACELHRASARAFFSPVVQRLTVGFAGIEALTLNAGGSVSGSNVNVNSLRCRAGDHRH
jgi:IstB-like ATP binding protein